MRFQDLLAYKKSFEVAMAIFEVSKSFPSEEKYSLTVQARRYSRSVSANIAEATSWQTVWKQNEKEKTNEKLLISFNVNFYSFL